MRASGDSRRGRSLAGGTGGPAAGIPAIRRLSKPQNHALFVLHETELDNLDAMTNRQPAGARRRGKPGLAVVRFAPWDGVERGHPRDLIWPTSALYALGEARRRGWDGALFDLHVQPRHPAALCGDLMAARPDLVLLDFSSASLRAATEVARLIRRADPGVGVWGVGQHPGSRPADLLDGDGPFDGVLRGEYDGALAALLDHGLDQRGPLPGAVTRFDPAAGRCVNAGSPHLVMDLDALPVIDPSPLPLSAYSMRSLHVPGFARQRWGFLQTSRGCPYRCLFCSPTLRQSHGHTFRGQSARRVYHDMARLHRDFGVTAVYMVDDLFTYDRRRVVELCELLRRRPLPVQWVLQTRVDCLDRELVAGLNPAGCRGLKLGIESGSDRVLRVLRKGITVDQALRTAAEVKRAGLSLNACFILGTPGETEEEMEQTFRLARRMRPDMIQVTFHTPYPGSESFRQHERAIGDPSELTHYEHYAAGLGALDAGRLERIQRRFYLRYYFHPSVLLNYLRRRAVYRLLDPDEWRLLAQTARFWLR